MDGICKLWAKVNRCVHAYFADPISSDDEEDHEESRGQKRRLESDDSAGCKRQRP